MSDDINGAMGEALARLAREALEKAKAMRPLGTGTLYTDHGEYTGYVFYEELGTPPNTIDSTATVIDENVKALPAPEVQE